MSTISSVFAGATFVASPDRAKYLGPVTPPSHYKDARVIREWVEKKEGERDEEAAYTAVVGEIHEFCLLLPDGTVLSEYKGRDGAYVLSITLQKFAIQNTGVVPNVFAFGASDMLRIAAIAGLQAHSAKLPDPVIQLSDIERGIDPYHKGLSSSARTCVPLPLFLEYMGVQGYDLRTTRGNAFAARHLAARLQIPV